MNFPHIKQHFPVSEIIEQYRGGEYSAALLLQHLLKHIMENQNELLEAALKLAERVTILHKHGTGMMPETLDLVATIERHRPKPARLEGWMNRYPDGTFGQELYPTAEKARIEGSKAIPIHLREVVPVEFIRWAPVHSGGTWWISDENSDDLLVVMPCKQAAVDDCDMHNAELERIANA